MFECEYCPYGIEEIQRRQKHLGMLPEDYQIEYCHCNKVGGEHYIYGYCHNYKEENIVRKGIRQGGRKYRQRQKHLKDKRLRNIINKDSGYAPHIGYIGTYRRNGEWVTDDYIKYPKNSYCQKYIKKLTSRKVRNTKDIGNHNQYRKLIDYWWIMY